MIRVIITAHGDARTKEYSKGTARGKNKFDVYPRRQLHRQGAVQRPY